MTSHLLVAISSHGYGHLAQVSPVINALQDLAAHALVPAFDLTIRSSLPRDQIARRINRSFHLDPGSDDFGMVMRDALRVDLVASLTRYEQLHDNWEQHVDDLARHLMSLGVSGVVADAPYLTLAAANRAGIPSIGICSLNWADILERCVAQQPDAPQAAGLSLEALSRILQQMRQAYACAQTIVQPEPAIDASNLPSVAVGPIMHEAASADRTKLLQAIQAQTGSPVPANGSCWIVLASMGGIGLPLDPSRWPTECLGCPVVYLMSRQASVSASHVVSLDFEAFGFSKLMASCDLVLTKPGYGMFVEARACCKPILYLARDTWPESGCLEKWANQYGHALKITFEQLAQGGFAVELQQLLSLPPLAPIEFDGALAAAQILADQLLHKLR